MTITLDNLKEVLLFYFLRLSCFGFLALWYFCFRSAITSKLERQKKMKLLQIDDAKKGFKNYWFYEKIHKKVNLGMLYQLNKIYVWIYFVLIIPMVFVGFYPLLGKVISLLSIPLFPIALIMTMIDNTERNLRYYKKRIVLFAINPNRRQVDSVFIDMIEYWMVGLYCYAQLKLAFS